jgi:hypothetical protein
MYDARTLLGLHVPLSGRPVLRNRGRCWRQATLSTRMPRPERSSRRWVDDSAPHDERNGGASSGFYPCGAGTADNRQTFGRQDRREVAGADYHDYRLSQDEPRPQIACLETLSEPGCAQKLVALCPWCHRYAPSPDLPSGRARAKHVMAAELPRQEFHDDIGRSATRQRGARSATEVRGRTQGVKLPVYKHLLEINAGFDQVVRGLAALRKEDAFLAKELDRFSALVKETRAATNSYLIGVLDREETREAGRRFGKRRDRELREE